MSKKIAEDLDFSVSTVKNHIQQIVIRPEVSDRTQAAVRAVELSLVGAG
jgi:DNA-binding NarL/FixJ family response regulator